jgi:type II secretion system (T2SS) protein M
VAPLSRRERSLVGLGLAAAVVVATYLYVVEPWLIRQRATAELIPAREATLERRRRLIAQHDRLAIEKDALGGQIAATAARLLTGPTPPLGASELQRVVKDAAASAGAEVRSERVLPAVDLSGLREVPIELTVAGTLRETVAWLAELERTPRLITIKDVKIRLVAPGQPRELVTTIVVSGYLGPS